MWPGPTYYVGSCYIMPGQGMALLAGINNVMH